MTKQNFYDNCLPAENVNVPHPFLDGDLHVTLAGCNKDIVFINLPFLERKVEQATSDHRTVEVHCGRCAVLLLCDNAFFLHLIRFCK